MDLAPQEVWSRLLECARREIAEHTFRTWLEPTQAVELRGDKLTVAVPDQFSADYASLLACELQAATADHLESSTPAAFDAMHAAGVQRNPRAELAGVWGRDAAKSAELAAELGTQSYPKVDALLANVDTYFTRTAGRPEDQWARQAAGRSNQRRREG